MDGCRRTLGEGAEPTPGPCRTMDRGRKKHTLPHTPEAGNRMHEGFMAVCKGFPASRCVPGVCGSVCFLPLYSTLFHAVAHERAGKQETL